MRWTLLVAVCVLLAPADAQARPRKNAGKKQAVEHAEAAQLAFDVGEYASAASEWQQAYKVSKDGKYLFLVAEAFRLKGDCSEALRHYQAYVAVKPTGDKRGDADKQIDVLGKQCPQSGPTPPPPVLEPEPETETGPETAAPDEPEAPVAREGRPGGGLRITGIVVGVAGLALGGTGVFFRMQASGNASDVTDACRVRCRWGELQDLEDKGKRNQTIGTMLLIGGGVAVVGGVILYVVGASKSTSEQVAVTPLPEGGMGVVWSGRF